MVGEELYFGAAVAVVALMWTIFQQYQIGKLCANCDFRKSAARQEYADTLTKQINEDNATMAQNSLIKKKKK